jgi:uncharacterized membrane protein
MSEFNDSMKEFLKAVQDTDKEFNGFPFLIRPFLKRDFESKTKLSIDQWKSKISAIVALPDNSSDIKVKVNALLPNVDLLLKYIDEIPKTAEKFINSKDQMDEITSKLNQRKKVIQKAYEKMKMVK